tara:strand:- start:64 stop:738 length:675 start_codon:yes stop_codon:yes gene_type:complete
MKAKKLVQYDYKNPKGVASYTFGNYKGKNGRIIEYKDINGNPDTITFKGASVLLDMDNEGHVLIDNFLKKNPDVVGGKWIRKDLHAIEKQKTKDTLDSARAIIEAAKMTDKEVKQMATLLRFNVNSEIDVLRAKMIDVAQNQADKFMGMYFDPEKDLRVFIIEAVRERKINYNNDTFYYGKEAIGTNEEQVLVWLKDNKDILAILKHEIRGEEKSKNKTVKIED